LFGGGKEKEKEQLKKKKKKTNKSTRGKDVPGEIYWEKKKKSSMLAIGQGRERREFSSLPHGGKGGGKDHRASALAPVGQFQGTTDIRKRGEKKKKGKRLAGYRRKKGRAFLIKFPDAKKEGGQSRPGAQKIFEGKKRGKRHELNKFLQAEGSVRSRQEERASFAPSRKGRRREGSSKPGGKGHNYLLTWTRGKLTNSVPNI